MFLDLLHPLLNQAAHPVPDDRLAVLAELTRALGRGGPPGAATAPARPSPVPPGGRTGHDLHDVGCGRCRHQGHGQRHLRADRALPAHRGPPVGQQGRPGGGVSAAAGRLDPLVALLAVQAPVGMFMRRFVAWSESRIRATWRMSNGR